MGAPSGPSRSTIAGILLFGLIARNSGLNCSPAPMFTGIARYARPHSSSMMWTLWPFGVAHEYTSIMAGCLHRGAGTRTIHHARCNAAMVGEGGIPSCMDGALELGEGASLDPQAHDAPRWLGDGSP